MQRAALTRYRPVTTIVPLGGRDDAGCEDSALVRTCHGRSVGLRWQSLFGCVIEAGRDGRSGQGVVRKKLGATDRKGAAFLWRGRVDVLPNCRRDIESTVFQLYSESVSDHVEVR